MADEARLVRAVENLIDNALSFSPAGGAVRISATRRDNDIAISVDDDGPGIPARFHDQVFKMFHTLKPRDQVEGAITHPLATRRDV